MPEFHRRLHYKGGQTVGLDHGTMKITTRLFNEEFLTAQANLDPDHGAGVDLNTAQNNKKQNEMNAADAEDARLNKMRIMQD